MVIENIQYVENFIYKKEVFIKIITGNENFHPILNRPVAVCLGIGSTFIIVPIDHPDGINLQLEILQNVLRQADILLTPNKKELLYFINHPNILDLHLIGLYPIPVESEVGSVVSYERKYNKHPELNKIIPIVKLYEKHYNEYIKISEELQKVELTENLAFLNNVGIPVCFLLERHGLGVHYRPFVELFKPFEPQFNIKNNVTYTWYNPYNITSRPTNAFNSVNFAAIPKKDEYRKCFVPQNDLFVEFDFDGYHLRLLAEQIGYEFTQEPAHSQLARLYFDKQEVTEEEYNQAKQLNFQALYGNTQPKHKEITFFNKLEKYTEDLWKEFSTKGYVDSPISMKRFSRKDLPDMNPKKLLNYIIQSLETARNLKVLKNLLGYLEKKESKVCLYTYDAILVDFKKDDGKETLENIQNILSEDGKYPVKFKYGRDLTFKN